MTNERPIAQCNCRYENICLIMGNFRIENVVYKCVVYAKEKSKEQVYIGAAEGDWKQLYYNHTMSFRNQRCKKDATLLAFLWVVKKSTTKEIPKLTWLV